VSSSWFLILQLSQNGRSNKHQTCKTSQDISGYKTGTLYIPGLTQSIAFGLKYRVLNFGQQISTVKRRRD